MNDIPDASRSITRRSAVAGAGSAMLAPCVSRAAVPTVKALAFDAFPIFDPRSIAELARELLREKGDVVAAAWLVKLFGYTWLETAAGRYEDFNLLADAALRVTAETLNIELTASVRERLVGSFEHLQAWPDVVPALDRLKTAGIRLCLLSNLGETTLRADMRNAGIADRFEAVLSTDRVRCFKPSPAAYHMAIDALGLAKHDIGFVAFGHWDAVGATWFGYRAAWIDRLDIPAERLDVRPEIVTHGIEGALRLAGLA